MEKFEIITTCAHCGKLVHLQNNIFSSIIFKWKNSTLPPNMPILYKKRSINFRCQHSQSYRYVKRLECVQKLLTYNGELLFPLCQDCSAIQGQQINFMIDFLNDASSDLFTINTTIPIDRIHIRMDQLSAYVNSKPSMRRRKRKSAPNPTNSPKVPIIQDLNDKKKKMLPEKESNFRNPIMAAFERLQSTACPLLSFYTFHISSNQHYGTINKARIGFFKYNPNTLTENNIATFFICQLIHYFKCIFQIPQICVNFNPMSILIITNKNTKINFSLHTLEFPVKRSRVSDFNESINNLFLAYDLINKASSRMRNFGEPPFNVDLKEKKIERFSFSLNWKQVEEWSAAMKLLLINLKMIQYRTFRGCINQF
ncbi:hypothetical protein M9Y10_022184 [Tritrichomonas musculus]|uniref:Atg6 BARA domain-containing protein n=1 Tax=Tritrichomonas musculus TaxID=1915356 RepID=A0ABR2KRL5_9EUKA